MTGSGYIGSDPRCPGRVEDGRFWTGKCHGPWVYDLKNEAQPQPDKRAALEWDLVATIAGSVAEAVYCCLRGVDKIEDFARNMGGGQRVDLLMAELRLMTNGRRRVVRPFVKRTIDFLEEHWHEVEALARVLAKEKKIEGDRIAEIVDAAALCNRTGRMPAI